MRPRAECVPIIICAVAGAEIFESKATELFFFAGLMLGFTFIFAWICKGYA